jgi:guanine nucleotide-binding protein G(i) subunit alpha
MGNKTNTKETNSIEISKENLGIILIGAGEVGKTCLFKQIKKIYSSTIEEGEEDQELTLVYVTILMTTKRILRYLHKCGKNHFEDPENLQRAKKILDVLDSETYFYFEKRHKEYTEEIHNMVHELWKENLIMETLEQDGNLLHTNENFQYFLERFEKFTPPDYCPTFMDCLQCYWKTVGSQSFSYLHQDVNFTIYDFGGQRNVRGKWYKNPSMYDEASCVVFVASLSEYDKTTYEDDVMNRMLENIEHFEEVINSNHLKTLPIFLFLTKPDIFKRKIPKKDLTCVFPEYKGGNDEDAAIDFIKMKYKNEIKIDPQRLQIFIVNSLDEDSVMEAFGEVENQMMELMIKMKGEIPKNEEK